MRANLQYWLERIRYPLGSFNVNANHWEPRIYLKDGVPMPLVGFGTQYGFSEDGHNRGRSENGSEYVVRALRAGFRLIDTARGYGSEAHVMRGIELSGLNTQTLQVGMLIGSFLLNFQGFMA